MFTERSEDNQTCPRVTVFNFGHFSGSRTTTIQVDGCEGPHVTAHI